MAQDGIVCPKCTQPMQVGFPLDRGEAPARVTEWVEGPPEYGWLGLRWFRKRRLPITTYRCRSGGYLESYATPK